MKTIFDNSRKSSFRNMKLYITDVHQECISHIQENKVILQAGIWVAIPISRTSSQPRDWTQISHIAGVFFLVWVTWEGVAYCLFVANYWADQRNSWALQETTLVVYFSITVIYFSTDNWILAFITLKWTLNSYWYKPSTKKSCIESCMWCWQGENEVSELLMHRCGLW